MGPRLFWQAGPFCAGERLAFDRFAAFFDEEHRADYARVKDRLPDDCLAEYFPELAGTQE